MSDKKKLLVSSFHKNFVWKGSLLKHHDKGMNCIPFPYENNAEENCSNNYQTDTCEVSVNNSVNVSVNEISDQFTIFVSA